MRSAPGCRWCMALPTTQAYVAWLANAPAKPPPAGFKFEVCAAAATPLSLGRRRSATGANAASRRSIPDPPHLEPRPRLAAILRAAPVQSSPPTPSACSTGQRLRWTTDCWHGNFIRAPRSVSGSIGLPAPRGGAVPPVTQAGATLSLPPVDAADAQRRVLPRLTTCKLPAGHARRQVLTDAQGAPAAAPGDGRRCRAFGDSASSYGQRRGSDALVGAGAGRAHAGATTTSATQ